jgi:hypothetical protein
MLRACRDEEGWTSRSRQICQSKNTEPERSRTWVLFFSVTPRLST